jgi:hypothetical protein
MMLFVFAMKSDVKTRLCSLIRQEYKISEQDFEILGELGAGSSGTVAKMSHKPTNRVIAVKVCVTDCHESVIRHVLMHGHFFSLCFPR